MFTYDERYQLLSNEAKLHSPECWIQSQSIMHFASQHSTPHGDQIESLWDGNQGRWGLELSMKPSLTFNYFREYNSYQKGQIFLIFFFFGGRGWKFWL